MDGNDGGDFKLRPNLNEFNEFLKNDCKLTNPLTLGKEIKLRAMQGPDLEKIFEKAMEEEKLNIALKAKELLARSKGWIGGGAASAPSVIKPINQWTLQEVNALIVQLDAYGDPDTESNSKG